MTVDASIHGKVVVVGAGVVGLTTAVELKRTFPNLNITIVAKNLPGDISPDYVSPNAGANWHSFADDDLKLQQYDKYSYFRILHLADNVPAAGVWRVETCEYETQYSLNKLGAPWKAPWYKNVVTGFEIIDEKELPKNAVFGYKFDGFVISVPTYLNYLFITAVELGITIRRITAIKNINEALHLHSEGEADFVVNCTGVLANTVSGYKDTHRQYPVLGQVLHVRNSTDKIFSIDTVDGKDTRIYIFPRKEGGCIIGGCFKTDFDSLEEDKQLTQLLIERAKFYVPQLVDPKYKSNPDFIDVVRVNVGQRPFRDGGIRIERDPDLPWLIHNYGAGAGGYQGSYGFSNEVIKIVKKMYDSKF